MLNQVHRLQRQAEKATRKGHLAEAIQLHREAAETLQHLLGEVVHEKAKESLRLQAEFHQKEQRLLNQYRGRIEAIEEGLRQLRVNMERREPSEKSPDDYGFKQLKTKSGLNLQQNIYRTFEEAESLLDRLKVDQDAGNVPQSCPAGAMDSHAIAQGGTKKPKDDKVIIEELEVANCHLRRMVDSLFVELDHCQRENNDLKERIQELEEQIRLSQLQQHARAMRANMDELPPLPPLDVPTFDFDA